MNTYDRVKKLLELNPELRDSDRKLIWRFWENENGRTYEEIDFDTFMGLTSTESIRRARQKVQEQHPELSSSKSVQAMKDEKEQMHGNFIYF